MACANTVEHEWVNSNAIFYQKDNLVFAVVLKNASTYYQTLLEKFNDWQLVTLDTINWEENYVFGFITDPVERYLKGLTEDLYGKFKTVNDVISYLEMSENSTVISFHSIPLTAWFGKYAYKINWVPLDQIESGDDYLKNLCEKNNVSLTIPKNIDKHVSTSDKLKFYHTIKSKLNNFHHTFWLTYAADIDLYTNASLKFFNSETVIDSEPNKSKLDKFEESV